MRRSWKVVVALALASFAAPAAAAAPTRIPQQTVVLNVLAAPHTVNHVTIAYEVYETLENGFQVDDQTISDTAGVESIGHEDQACVPSTPNLVKCLDTATLTGVPAGSTGTGDDPAVYLGDGDDTLVSDNVGDLMVNAGAGNDRLTSGTRPMIFGEFEGEPATVLSSEEEFLGGSGNDVLIGRGQPDYLRGGAGNDKLDGGPGSDSLYGDAGNDVIDARDGHRDRVIDCGPGRKDRALVDKVDPKPISC